MNDKVSPEGLIERLKGQVKMRDAIITGCRAAMTVAETRIEQLEAKCAQRRDDLKQARDILDERFKRIEQLEAVYEAAREIQGWHHRSIFPRLYEAMDALDAVEDDNE